MDRFREILLFFAGCMAFATMVLAAYQAFNNKIGSAVALGAFFVVCTLFVFFPRLEFLKVFGVEARLTQTLDRAEDIIGKMKELSAITARTNYMLMAWGNRMGTPSAKDRQAIMDQVDKQLSGLEVTPDERANIARPYLRMIGFDFHLWFTRLFDRYIEWKQNDLVRQNQVNPTEEKRKEIQNFIYKQSAWRSRALGPEMFHKLDTYNLADELQRVMPTDVLSESENRAAESLKTQLVRMFAECERKGGYTPEAAEFFDRYHDLGGQDAKIKELFGVSVSETR
jgi:hypothetical protein